MADEPYRVQHPVAFVPGGDTTRDAFHKHIQEIEEIYGILNALNSDKLDSKTLTDAIKEHINDKNPHPNYKIDMDMIEGNLEGWRVSGIISNATIPSKNVTGLEPYVKGLIPESKGEGITDLTISGEEVLNGNYGSLKFNNGLIVKWGTFIQTTKSETTYEYKFPKKFPEKCMNVMLTMGAENKGGLGYIDAGLQLIYDTISETGFSYFLQQYRESPIGQYGGHIAMLYIAIGM